MRSDYMPKGEILHLLGALMPENRLACEISLATGLRINDVLSLPTSVLKKDRFTVREEKTGKTKNVRLPADLRNRCFACAGQHYIFEHRTNGRKHRTRQAVFKDLRRVSKAFKCKSHLSPHSLRKIYAVEEYKRHCDLKRVQRLLNHNDEAVTYLYAMADVITNRKNFTKNRKK